MRVWKNVLFVGEFPNVCERNFERIMWDALSNVAPEQLKMGFGGFAAVGLALSFLPRTRFMQIKRLERALTNRCIHRREKEKQNVHISSHFRALPMKGIFKRLLQSQKPIVWEMPEGTGSSTIIKMNAKAMPGVYINVHDSPIFSGTDLMFHIFRKSGVKFAPAMLTELGMLNRFFRQDIKFATDCYHTALKNISRRTFRKLEHRPLIIIDNIDKLDVKLFNSSENSDIFWNFVHVLSSTKLANIVFVANSGWYSKLQHDIVFAPTRNNATSSGEIQKNRSDCILKAQDFVQLSMKAFVTPELERFVEESAIPASVQSEAIKTCGPDVSKLLLLSEYVGDDPLSESPHKSVIEEFAAQSWQKYDAAFKLMVEELATVRDNKEERLKSIGRLNRLWKLLSLLLEQNSIQRQNLEDTLFAGHALDLDLFASQKLIFIGYDLNGGHMVSFRKETDLHGVKKYMNSPRYSIVLGRLRQEEVHV